MKTPGPIHVDMTVFCFHVHSLDLAKFSRCCIIQLQSTSHNATWKWNPNINRYKLLKQTDLEVDTHSMKQISGNSAPHFFGKSAVLASWRSKLWLSVTSRGQCIFLFLTPFIKFSWYQHKNVCEDIQGFSQSCSEQWPLALSSSRCSDSLQVSSFSDHWQHFKVKLMITIEGQSLAQSCSWSWQKPNWNC